MRALLIVSLLIPTACAAEMADTEVGRDELAVLAIPRGSTWRYWDRGGDLGTSWRGTFDDASWRSGAGALGYGESYLRTTVSGGPITTYFRATFTVSDPAAITGMMGEVMYDDGFVVYLNGTEIQRRAMPSGTITAATLSTGHEASNTYARHDWSARKNLLVAGTNTIAVEVHQASATSSDVVFDLGLTFQTSDMPPPDGDDIPRGSSWWYWDKGGNLGTAWRALAGAASGWEVGEGPIGYGESYLRTTADNGGITAYFRREIVVEDPATVDTIFGDVMYDDGFVVYLNGTEIQRAAMPSGTITASTLSTGHEASNTYATFDWTAHRNLLRAGTNVIAVEVHQASASSSDLVFDAAFWVGTAAPPPAPTNLGGIAARSDWGYWDVSGEPEPDWKSTPYYAEPWDRGNAPLGFGESYVWNQLAPGRVTYYFKAPFYTDDPSAVTRMFCDLQYDDGAVVYLNGTEILRASMPSGTITPTTLAAGHEAAADTYESFDVTSKRNLLVAGQNVVAVEVHQSSASSSDLVFDMLFQLRGP